MPLPKPKPAKLREVLTGDLAATHGPLPKLLLPGDDAPISTFIEEAYEIIVRSQTDSPDITPQLFRRDVLPIIPLPGTRRFAPMKPEYFLSWAERHFMPFKTRYDREGTPFDVIKSMTKEIAKSCLESITAMQNLSNIKRTYPIPMPVIPEGGGKLRLAMPGYDEETGSYVFDSDIPKNPAFLNPDSTLLSSNGYYDDHRTLHQAVTHLHDLFCKFPYSDWAPAISPTEESPFYNPEDPAATYRFSRSLAVQVMAMLSVFASGCVPPQASRLGFLFNANTQRSGKTLGAKMTVSPIYGSFKVQSWRDKEDDMLKVLDSETLAATTYICFDNIRSLIASAPLEGFMTAPVWTGRILGRSEMFEAENNAILLLTANNASLGPDMQERVLICDLYVENADRQERAEELDPSREIDDVWLAKPENRIQILSSLWSIVRHWDAAGRPLASGKARKGFTSWCNILAGMVEFAGFGDALEHPVDLENCGDSESEDIRTLVSICSIHDHTEHTFQGIVHICWENGLIPWCMHGREDYSEDLQKVTIKLSDQANSRFGILLQRSTSGARGSTHTFRKDGELRQIRFHCKGKGRSRRFHFDLISKPN